MAKKAGPDYEKTIVEVQKGLTLPVMQELDARVELEKQSPAKAAAAYLEGSRLHRLTTPHRPPTGRDLGDSCVPFYGPSRGVVRDPREGDAGRPGGGEAGDRRQQQRHPRVIGLREPAGERAADRGRAEEDDRVERHHPAAHRRLDRELQGRVDRSRRR